MNQLPLFESEQLVDRQRVVNIASVPHRSPFRYPGGKTWLVPRFRQWMRSHSRRPTLLIEPFAGGGVIGLTSAFENWTEQVILVELDPEVAAVWQTLLNGEAPWLAERILRFDLNPDSVKEIIASSPVNVRDIAFRTIVKNRTFHGGILAPGSGVIKHGEAGRGLKSRWYPETLKKRILNIDAIRERIEFIHGDGMEVIAKYAKCSESVFFIDPPYTVAGKKAGARLYKYFELDHEQLFSRTASIQGDFLMTYDNAEGVHDLVNRHGFDSEIIAMQNTHLAKMTELLIGPSLDWIR